MTSEQASLAAIKAAVAKAAASQTETVPETPLVTPEPMVPFAPPQNAGKSSLARAIYWCMGGFVVGIAFWNFIGFWDFIGTVVLSSPKNKSEIELTLQRPPLSIKKHTASIAPDHDAARQEQLNKCVALELNREQNQTTTKPCSDTVMKAPRTTGPKLTVARGDKL